MLRPLDDVAVFAPAAQALAPLGRLDAPRSGVRSALGLDGDDADGGPVPSGLLYD